MVRMGNKGVNSNRKFFIGLGIALVFFSGLSSSAFAFEERTTSRQSLTIPHSSMDAETPSAVGMVSSLVEHHPSLDHVFVPGPVGSPSPIQNSSQSSTGGSIGSSTLTINEMRLVMGPGRHVDLKTGKRTLRPGMWGVKRENFLMSWEASRVRNRVKQLTPVDLAYSATPNDSFIRFD